MFQWYFSIQYIFSDIVFLYCNFKKRIFTFNFDCVDFNFLFLIDFGSNCYAFFYFIEVLLNVSVFYGTLCDGLSVPCGSLVISLGTLAHVIVLSMTYGRSVVFSAYCGLYDNLSVTYDMSGVFLGYYGLCDSSSITYGRSVVFCG